MCIQWAIDGEGAEEYSGVGGVSEREKAGGRMVYTEGDNDIKIGK